MSVARYRIPDEPAAIGAQRLIVDPMWPLLTVMFAGFGFSLAWFLANGIALGSPNRTREWLWVAGGLIGCWLLLFAQIAAAEAGWIDRAVLPYSLIAVTCVKLGVAYRLHLLQATPFELWRHFGGKPAAGWIGLIAAAFVSRRLFAALPETSLLVIVLR